MTRSPPMTARRRLSARCSRTSRTRSGRSATPVCAFRPPDGSCSRHCSPRTARSPPRISRGRCRSTSPRCTATSSCSSAAGWSATSTSATPPASTSSSSEHEVEYLYCERCAKVTAVAPDRLEPDTHPDQTPIRIHARDSPTSRSSESAKTAARLPLPPNRRPNMTTCTATATTSTPTLDAAPTPTDPGLTVVIPAETEPTSS